METYLYLVATPIGNLDDITFRAVEVLKKVDIVACEDTRKTSRLLSHFKINKKLISLHQHNEKNKTDFLINLLLNGNSVAFVSDAGTPAVSDPGAFLVNQALEKDIKVSPIPGPSSITSAFSVSGVQTTQFKFFGFLPNTSGKCKKVLEEIYNQDLPTIIFESPHRIMKTLSLIKNIFGSSYKLFIARELSKIYETIYKDNIESIIKKLESHPEEQQGEFVIIFDGKIREIENFKTLSLDKALEVMIKELPLNQSVKLISKIFKKNKKEVYNQALELKK
ncbi:MAG: 16S rRNA (cytidine(1402)-2'-O)-methyltransferase [Nitrosomonadales bacterium]|nr:16S rRNA (cytidine(1402)-2'-O)-methyltransferase [Nitrosomonadales bacterium]MBC67206.1 16S rRNA (cytidine(1402)-2'-O)-methyltransferase [Paracoccaceae bacterium]|tara:strand:- start:138 stop:974 length:837 start_codon:yes stop_codon:yes gene_type:complete